MAGAYPRWYYFTILVLLASLVPAGLVTLATNDGVNLSPDSNQYLSAAASFLAGQGLVRSNGQPFESWPPVYPVALALLSPLDKAHSAARAINIAAIGLTAGLVIAWAHSQYSRPLITVAVAMALSLSPPLLYVAQWAWSEPLFILLVTIYLLALGMYFRTGRNSAFLLVCTTASLAWLTRYLGVVIVFVGLVSLLACQHTELHRRAKDGLLFGLATCVPMALWLGRNYVVTGTLTGLRGPSAVSFLSNLRLTATTMLGWGPLVALFSLLALPVLGRLRRQSHSFSSLQSVVPIMAVAFVACYALFLVVSASLVAYDPIDDRLLAPVYAPLVLAIAGAYDWLAAP